MAPRTSCKGIVSSINVNIIIAFFGYTCQNTISTNNTLRECRSKVNITGLLSYLGTLTATTLSILGLSRWNKYWNVRNSHSYVATATKIRFHVATLKILRFLLKTHCSNRSLYKLEKVHKQALRVVLNDYSSSYRNLLDKVSKPTLYVSRLKAIAIEAYKCKANENPDYINVMLNPLIKPYNLRGGPRAEQPKVNTTSCGLNSFTYQVAKLWNEIPSSIKDANSLFHFKSLLSKWAGPECHCGSCILCKVYDV